MRRGPRRREAGYVTLFTLGVSMALVSSVGLVLDGGRAQRAQSDAFGAAAAAARAGAQEIDAVSAVNGQVRLDRELAAETARTYLAARGVSGAVEATDTRVIVTVSRQVDYLIVPGTTRLDATATSRITQERAP